MADDTNTSDKSLKDYLGEMFEKIINEGNGHVILKYSGAGTVTFHCGDTYTLGPDYIIVKSDILGSEIVPLNMLIHAQYKS